MRTPWKMLADLVSGKSSKDEPEIAANIDDAQKPETPTASYDVSTKHNTKIDTLVSSDVEQSLEIVDEFSPDTDHDAAESNALPSASDPSHGAHKEFGSPKADVEPSKQITGKVISKSAAPRKAKTASAKSKLQRADVPVVTSANDTGLSLLSAADEMITLDRDIKNLRHQLEEKLTVQNAQLRKLLGRYDRG